jgi:DNA-binding GntR family transcriptional regulator
MTVSMRPWIGWTGSSLRADEIIEPEQQRSHGTLRMEQIAPKISHGSAQLEPVSGRVTIGGNVYQQLRQALMSGSFMPGQVMTIDFLARTFQTSHMPVREATRRLVAEEALELAPNGSTRVPNVSVDRLDDIYRNRMVIEGSAVSRAITVIRPRDLEQIEQLVHEHDAMSERGQVYEMLQKNQELHFTIYRLSRSPITMQIVESLWLRHGPYMRLLSWHCEEHSKQGASMPTSHHHWQLLEAIRTRNNSAAVAELQADISGSHELLKDLCRDHNARNEGS